MVSVIVIDFKSMEQTMSYIDNFIDKVADAEDINFIIIDNSQDDNNFNKLAEKYKLIECLSIDDSLNSNLEKATEKILLYEYNHYKLVAIQSNANLGFAKANNLGALISKKIFNDYYIIFSNNDLVIKNKFSLKLLIKPFKINPNIAVVGPKIIGLDNKPQSPREKVSIWRLLVLRNINMLTLNWFNKFVSDIDYTGTSKYAYWVVGCFMVVDSEKFFQVGMFDSNTFLYGEEMILSERLLEKKYSVYFLNQIEIIHSNGGTTKKTFRAIKACKLSFDSVYYYYKNYIKCNWFQLFMAKLSFVIFKTLFPIKRCIKRLVRGSA